MEGNGLAVKTGLSKRNDDLTVIVAPVDCAFNEHADVLAAGLHLLVEEFKDMADHRKLLPHYEFAQADDCP